MTAEWIVIRSGRWEDEALTFTSRDEAEAEFIELVDGILQHDTVYLVKVVKEATQRDVILDHAGNPLANDLH